MLFLAQFGVLILSNLLPVLWFSFCILRSSYFLFEFYRWMGLLLPLDFSHGFLFMKLNVYQAIFNLMLMIRFV